MVLAIIQSQARNDEIAKPTEVEMIETRGNNDFIVRTPEGILCHAIYNPFTGLYYADDIYGKIN